MTEEQPPVENPQNAEPAPAEPAARQAGTGASLAGRFGRFLLRLLVVLVLGAALGAGLYYGAIRLYRDAIEPLRTLDSRLEDIQLEIERQATLQADQATGLRERMADLEGRAALLTEQVSELEASLTVQREDLDALQARQAELGSMQSTLDGLQADLETLDGRLQAVEEQIAAEQLPAQQMTRSLQVLQAMTIMTRARLSLTQLNLGLAQADLGAASDILAILVAAAPEGLDAETAPSPQLLEARVHLDAALANVLARPAVAEDELEIAWKLLVELTGASTEASAGTGGQ